MKLKREGDGVYTSKDGRVVIKRLVVDEFTGRRYRKQTVWLVSVNCKQLQDQDSRSDAVIAASRYLQEKKELVE